MGNATASDRVPPAFDNASYAVDVTEDKEWIKLENGKTWKHPSKKTILDHLYAVICYPAGWKASDRRPGAVVGYGGGWKGYPNDNIFRTIEDGKRLAKRGVVAVVFHYRPGLAAGVEDASAVIRWTRKHAGELGIDPNRIIGMGGSSGGHITLSATVLRNNPSTGRNHEFGQQ